jgi:UDP-2,3-diacylglucosamine hydrolase
VKFLLPPNKKIYFASDLHLTMAPDEDSRRRELDFVQWLDTVKNDAATIFLLGDMFDFWFEYRHVVPRGFVRLLGKLAEITDSGIPIHFFTGNHDQWIRNYLSYEININIYRQPTEFNLNGKLFLIGHGHDINPESFDDRMLNCFFKSRLLRILYASLHPFWGIAFGKNWSRGSRQRHGLAEPFEGLEKEFIYRYAKKVLAGRHYDFFVFGHRHMAMDINLGGNSRYINTGEWLKTQTYAVFDGEDISLHSAKGDVDFLRMS